MFKRALCIAAMLLAPLSSALAQSYNLGPEDKIRVRVVEWEASRATATNWEVLGGDYVVGADGSVVLPMIGPIAVAGMTPEALAARIGDELDRRYGLMERMNAAVEVIEYRPVYVLGQVANPGAYPYRPGLTVLQAVSLAGGLYRGGDNGLRFERDAINSGGDLEVLRLQRARLLARAARLRTELAKGDSVEMTDELREKGVGESVLADENALAQARAQNLRSQTEAISRLQELLKGELDAIQRKIDSENRLLTLSQEELESVGSLIERGLAVNSREREMVRIVAETESRLIDLQTLALRARQEMSRAQRDLLQIQTQHHADIVRELQETQAQINENAVRQATAVSILNQVAGASTRTDAELALAYTVLRPGCPDDWVVSAKTALKPGDTLEVSRGESPEEPTEAANDCASVPQSGAADQAAENRTN